MRINVYSQELTNETKVVTKVSNTGAVYTGVQLMLHSSELLHNTPEDDDRSAVTFWLPKSLTRRLDFAQALEQMARNVRASVPEDAYKMVNGDDCFPFSTQYHNMGER
jgi:hypothetical protein